MARNGFFRRFLERRLEQKLDDAVSLGAMDQSEADEIREKVKVVEFLVIIELIMMILEAIRAWKEQRDNRDPV